MAARTAIARRASTPTVRVTLPPGVRRAAGRLARRGVGVAAQAAKDERHTLIALAAAGLLGAAQGSGVQLPYVQAIGMPATAGIVAWAAGRFSKNKTVQHVATGLLSVAAYDLARSMTSGSGGRSTGTGLPPSLTTGPASSGDVLHGEVLGGEL